MDPFTATACYAVATGGATVACALQCWPRNRSDARDTSGAHASPDAAQAQPCQGSVDTAQRDAVVVLGKRRWASAAQMALVALVTVCAALANIVACRLLHHTSMPAASAAPAAAAGLGAAALGALDVPHALHSLASANAVVAICAGLWHTVNAARTSGAWRVTHALNSAAGIPGVLAVWNAAYAVAPTAAWEWAAWAVISLMALATVQLLVLAAQFSRAAMGTGRVEAVPTWLLVLFLVYEVVAVITRSEDFRSHWNHETGAPYNMVGWGSSYRQLKTQNSNALRFHALMATLGWWPVFFQLSEAAMRTFPRVHKWTGRLAFLFLLPAICHTPWMVWRMHLSLVGRIIAFGYSLTTNAYAWGTLVTGFRRRIPAHRRAAFRMWWLVLAFTVMGRAILGVMHGVVRPRPNTPEGWYSSFSFTVYILGAATFVLMEVFAYRVQVRRGTPQGYRFLGVWQLACCARRSGRVAQVTAADVLAVATTAESLAVHSVKGLGATGAALAAANVVQSAVAEGDVVRAAVLKPTRSAAVMPVRGLKRASSWHAG